MAMKITQGYMNEEVVKRLKAIEEKTDLALSNTALLVCEFDKVIKNLKKKVK